jgi:hypothetical protein
VLASGDRIAARRRADKHSSPTINQASALLGVSASKAKNALPHLRLELQHATFVDLERVFDFPPQGNRAVWVTKQIR